MKYQVVNYEQKYETDIIQIWNTTLVYDVINKERFMNRILLDDNFNDRYFLVALEERRVVGFLFGIKRRIPYLERGLEETRGWINLIAMAPEYQRKGLGRKLLKEIEQRFMQDGVKEITLCAYSPNYLTPGIDIRYPAGITFFEKHGYTLSGDAVSMKCDLWDYHMNDETRKRIEELKAEGITIKPYTSNYCISLLSFLDKEFGAGWKRNALLAMQQWEAEDTIFLAVNDKEEIVGFVMRKIDGNDARFGPIGVMDSIRSKGLGGLLLETIMQDMREREIFEMYFLWTHGAAIRFYERHGFTIFREYKLYKRVI